MTQARPPRDLAELTEIVADLTNPRQHRQSYRAGWRHPNRTGAIIRDHVSQQPSLLSQLRDAISHRPGTGSGRAGSIVYTNLPRFSEDAYDRLQAITNHVYEWHAHLGLDSRCTDWADGIRRHLDVIETLLKGSGLATHATDAASDVLRDTAARMRTHIDVDIRNLLAHASRTTLEVRDLDRLTSDADHWRTWCRIVTGWDTPALRPHIPCPHCKALAGEREGLRLRIHAASGAGGIIEDAILQAAVCLTCNMTWDAGGIHLLAEQLRQTEQLLDGAA